jgi:hypothetical protein
MAICTGSAGIQAMSVKDANESATIPTTEYMPNRSNCI